MYWTQAVDGRSRNTSPDWLFDIAENAIPPDQRIGDNPAVEMILSPVAVVEPRGEWLRSPNALLVTQSQLVFAYKRGLGRRGVVHGICQPG